MTLNDRKEYISKKNIPLCEEGCEYEVENFESFQFVCYCKIKNNKEDIYLNQLINETIDIKYSVNFRVLECYNLFFSILGQANNYFFYLFIILFLINIFLIIVNEVYLKDILNELINYCKEYIDNIDKNNKEEEFKLLREIYLGKKKDEENLKRCVYERILNSPPKKKCKTKKSINIEKIKTIMKKLEKYIKLYFFKKLILFNIKKRIYNMKEDTKFYNYYTFLIFGYLKQNRKNYLIEEELNDLHYEYYRNIEDRKWCKIYWSLFKSNCDLINTFFIFNKYKDFRLYFIKIMIYLNSIMTSIIINIVLFWDETTMHKIYEDDGEYNLLYQLPKICIFNLSISIISFLYHLLMDYQYTFIELKNNLNIFLNKDDKNKIKYINNSLKEDKISINSSNTEVNTGSTMISEDRLITKIKYNILESIINNNREKEEFGYKIKKSFLRNRIIFYIFIIILNIFSWYYVSCFFAIYKKTQKHLFLNFIYGILNNLISCSLTCLINIILKFIIIKEIYRCCCCCRDNCCCCRNKCCCCYDKCCCCDKQILGIINFNSTSFIIEKIIEFIIIIIILTKSKY